MDAKAWSETIRKVLLYQVKQAFNLGNINSVIGGLSVALQAAVYFKISESTTNVICNFLLEKFRGASSALLGWYYCFLVQFMKLGASRLVAENILVFFLTKGFSGFAEETAKYIGRKLEVREILIVVDHFIKMNSYSGVDENLTIGLAERQGHSELIPKIRLKFKEKRKRFESFP